MTAGPGAGRPTTLELPQIEADPLFADAVGDAIAGDAAAMPGVLDRPVGRDPHDFSSLYVRHRSSFVAHARRYLSDQRDIDEVVQESLLRLFLALPELETELQALAYCRRTVTNLCIDRYRAQARRPRLVGYDEATDVDLWDDGNIDDPIYAAEDAAIVREALALLSPTHRDALIKREVEEKSLAQIALEMGIPETAVKHTLHRARRSLRRALATLWEESGQGVKSALVLILAVLMALPFLSRGGNNGVVSETHQAFGTQTPTPTAPTPVAVPTNNGDPQPTIAATSASSVTPLPAGPNKWPTVPGLSLPSVPVPPVVTLPTPQPTPSTGPTTPTPNSTPTPTPPPATNQAPPVGDPSLSVMGTYQLVGAATITQHLAFVQPVVGSPSAHTVTGVNTLQAATTDGNLILDQSFTKFANGAMEMQVVSSLPLGGKSVATALKGLDYDAQLNADQSVAVTVTANVSVLGCDIPTTASPYAVTSAQVDIHLQLSPDLASVIAEHVVVSPTQLAGGAEAAVGCGGPPALPSSTDGSQSLDPTTPAVVPSVEVKEQVTSTS